MRLPYLGAAVVRDVLLLLLLLVVSQFDAATAHPEPPTPSPLWIQPSGEWYGIDGTWSNFAFYIGSPAQVVYLSVATALSEIWVVSTGGCVPVQLCIDARGGVFDISQSETWRSLGGWQLGMNYTGMGGNGDYGLETLAFVNRVTRFTTAVDGALVAAINDTDYYQGYIGVGVTQGRFGSNLTNPFISQLAQTYGTIPSHGYGYTAGAYYRTDGTNGGTVASLTLGGYDTLRFEPHNTKFTLDPVTRLPVVRLRGITATVPSIEQAPTKNWTSTERSFVKMDDTIIATIDSSTPYLWLPTEVCERFATALNLKWREDLGLYVFSDGAQYTNYQTSTSLSFTFSLSSYQNADNFGQPFNTPGVVNITLPSAAFAQLLRYPFKNIIQWGDSSVPYFPLKRSTKEVNDNRYIIGRAFLQEAYIITSYDRGTYSVHQALFPQNATKNYLLEEITRPTDSTYPEYEGQPMSDHGLSTGQTVGIVLGAFIVGSIVALLLWFCLVRKRKDKQKEVSGQEDENKDGPPMMEEEEEAEPTSPVKRMFTKIIRKKRSRKPAVHETDAQSTEPVEVGADAQHQVFEMPVPPEPVELDSHDVGDDDTEFGAGSTRELSQYEITRRKLDRQLQGPVPTYTPAAAFPTGLGPEKSMHDTSPVAHYRPIEDPSPASSPTYANSNSLPGTLPSPMTPHVGDWPNRAFDIPSPMTVAPPAHFLHTPLTGGSDPNYSPVSPHSPHSPHTYAPSSITRTESNDSPTSPTGSMQLPSPTFQRTPIDPSRVVCLGPLPENVQLPRPQQSIPRIVTTAHPPSQVDVAAGPAYPCSRGLPLPQPLGHHRSHTQGSTDTLGSNFTVEEETRLRTDEGVLPRQPSMVHEHEHQGHGHDPDRDRDQDQDVPRTPCSMERIDGGSELIHVPQVAEKRYSWEEDRGGSLS